MLHIIFGTDTEAKDITIASVIKKIEDREVSVVHRDAMDMTILDVDTIIESQSLFHTAVVLVVAHLKENKEVWQYVIKKSDALVRSANSLILNEPILLKKEQNEFADGVTFESLKDKEKITKTPFNVFAITDAFGARDKRAAWLLYREAIDRAHIEPREIHGAINWIVKSMMQTFVLGESDLAKIGVKPFVASKAKRYAKNFKKSELFEIGNSLVSLYHTSLRGEVELEEGLESLLLSSLSS